MYVDIVFPDGNEKEFLETAEKLGYSRLVFVYEKQIPEAPKSKIKIITGLVAEEKTIQRAKNLAGLVLVKSSRNDRWVLEKSKADILFGLEEGQRKDFMHHRASGLNQILCKIAKQKDKMIAFSFSAILNSKGERRAQLLGKMMQNIKFCRKYKVRTILASFAKTPYGMRAPNDLVSFGVSLGMHPKEAKDSMSWTK
ncbi:hypothetical protein JW707_05085 [Candidatus Woesearchaeota archaeon]|nr:hypothetical protein [Candidatus Woesearchaeota archaeon]